MQKCGVFYLWRMYKKIRFVFFLFILCSCSPSVPAGTYDQLPGLHIHVKADAALFIEGKACGTTESRELEEFLLRLPEEQRDTLPVFLHIDRDTRMKNVTALRNTLRECGIRKINYVSTPEKTAATSK